MSSSESPTKPEDSLLDLLNLSEDFEAMDLHKACRLGDLRAIELAVRAQPDKINSRDTSVGGRQLGWAPLYRTVICGHLQAAEFLLEHGADPNVVNNVRVTQLGETPLHHVADNSQLELAELLLHFRADPNKQQTEGNTPLHQAAFRGDDRMIALLLRAGADCNLPNFLFGQTPLHYAAEGGFAPCVRIMLEFHGDPQLPDKVLPTQQGKTPVDLAKDPGVRRIFDLYESGALLPVEESNAGINSSEIPSFSQSEIVVDNFSRRIDLRDVAPAMESFTKHDSKQSSKKPSPTKKAQISEPDAEKSISRSKPNLRTMSDWLEKRGLSELYDVLVIAGYDDIEAMADQMKTPLPLTEESLKAIGVKKPGHCARLIMKLEEEAGIVTRRSRRRAPSMSQASGILSSCAAPSNATFGAAQNSPLRDWLQRIKLEHLFPRFVDSGYDDYDSLLAQMAWKRPISDAILEQEIGIEKPGYRSRILSKLQEEAQGITRTYIGLHSRSESVPGVSIENTSKTAACDFCTIQ